MTTCTILLDSQYHTRTTTPIFNINYYILTSRLVAMCSVLRLFPIVEHVHLLLVVGMFNYGTPYYIM